MRYFRLSINDSEELWGKYKAFDIDFVVDGERLYANHLCVNIQHKHMPIIKTLVAGVNPAFSMVGTDGIIVKKKNIDDCELTFSGLLFTPVMDEETEELYYLMCFTEAIECVNLELSSYEKWPEGEVLTSLRNHIGRWFFTPVLYAEKIPENLEAFTLKNWGGPFNMVVSENLKKGLQLIDDADHFLIFTELQVV